MKILIEVIKAASIAETENHLVGEHGTFKKDVLDKFDLNPELQGITGIRMTIAEQIKDDLKEL